MPQHVVAPLIWATFAMQGVDLLLRVGVLLIREIEMLP